MNEGLCLDAGALIGVERGNRWLLLLLERVRAAGHAIEVPAGVLAQVWRGGSRQARLARFLNTDGVRVVDLHRQIALPWVNCAASAALRTSSTRTSPSMPDNKD